MDNDSPFDNPVEIIKNETEKEVKTEGGRVVFHRIGSIREEGMRSEAAIQNALTEQTILVDDEGRMGYSICAPVFVEDDK